MTKPDLKTARVQVAFYCDAVANGNIAAVEALRERLMRNAHYNPAVDYIASAASPNVLFSADLDMVPGWGHEPADWEALVRAACEGAGVSCENLASTTGKGLRHYMKLVTTVATDIAGPLDPVALWAAFEAEIGRGRMTLADARANLPDRIDYAYDARYVVYTGDLNSLYDDVPREPVVMLRTRTKADAEAAVHEFTTHDVAAWYVPEAAGDHDRRAEARARGVRWDTLHVGDRVLIWFAHQSAGAQLRSVVVTAITERDGYNSDGSRMNPAMHWEADPAYDSDWYTNTDGTRTPLAACDVSHVIAILHRAPWRTGPRLPTNMYAVRMHGDRRLVHDLAWHVAHRVGDTVAIHPFQLAQCMLAVRPGLHVPERLDTDRFWAAWNRAQRPGLRGHCYWDNGPRIAPLGRTIAARDTGFRYTEHWINLKAFRRWFLRVWPTLLVTRATIRAEGIEHARWEEAQYAKDMEREYERTYGSRMDDLADDAHMEDDMADGYYYDE